MLGLGAGRGESRGSFRVGPRAARAGLLTAMGTLGLLVILSTSSTSSLLPPPTARTGSGVLGDPLRMAQGISSTPVAAPDTGEAGYILLNPHHGVVTGVTDTYTQPRVDCINAEDPSGVYVGYQNAWVGPGLLNGTLSLSSFAGYQMGTEAVCQQFYQNPVYLPFYYRLAIRPFDPPNPDNVMHPILGVAVSAGDSLRASMSIASGRLTFNFTDLTTGRSVSSTASAPGYQPNGAFCILEPFGNLAKFATFTQSCAPTVGGTTEGIGDFPSPSFAFNAAVTNATGAVAASVTNLSHDGSSFSTSWVTSQYLGSTSVPAPYSLFPDSNVAGYLLLGRSQGSVHAVSDTFSEPAATCRAGEAHENATGHYPGDQIAFVGPGLYSGNSNFSSFRFYQVGIEAYCQQFFSAPVYLPFYLTAVVTPSDPDGDLVMVALPSLMTSAGDSITATVREDAGGIHFLVTDGTAGLTDNATIAGPGSGPNGAACLLEPVYNVAKFGRLFQSCRVTIDNTTRGIGDFGAPTVLMKFDLHATADPMIVQARTSGLTGDGSTFSIAWITSRPLGR